MAEQVDITLEENADQTLALTVTRVNPSEDLTNVTKLRLTLRDDACALDADATLVLDSTDITQIKILSQSASTITAEAYIPASAVLEPYPRWYRLDAYVGSAHRPAIYGVATITNS